MRPSSLPSEAKHQVGESLREVHLRDEPAQGQAHKAMQEDAVAAIATAPSAATAPSSATTEAAATNVEQQPREPPIPALGLRVGGVLDGIVADFRLLVRHEARVAIMACAGVGAAVGRRPVALAGACEATRGVHGGVELVAVHLLPYAPQGRVLHASPPPTARHVLVVAGAAALPPPQALRALQVGLLHEPELHGLQEHAQHILDPPFVELRSAGGLVELQPSAAADRRVVVAGQFPHNPCGRGVFVNGRGGLDGQGQAPHVGADGEERHVHEDDADDRRPFSRLHDIGVEILL
mmetsp:Transcript_40196/g.113783  ORF Transcript_40196/g.113783 Transcript_40196/m.113783 type:complete len:294 (-) Transcript_40196:774-1655(-)